MPIMIGPMRFPKYLFKAFGAVEPNLYPIAMSAFAGFALPTEAPKEPVPENRRQNKWHVEIGMRGQIRILG